MKWPLIIAMTSEKFGELNISWLLPGCLQNNSPLKKSNMRCDLQLPAPRVVFVCCLENLLHVNLWMRQPFLRLITYKWSSKPARNQPVDGQHARIHYCHSATLYGIWYISAKKFHNQTARGEIMATRKTQNLKQALFEACESYKLYRGIFQWKCFAWHTRKVPQALLNLHVRIWLLTHWRPKES